MWRCLTVAALAAVSLLDTGSARAQEVKASNIVALGAEAGTLGIGGNLSYLLYDTLVIRAAGSQLSLDSSVIKSRGNNLSLNGTFIGGMIDWHPFRSGWFLSAGVRHADLKLKSDTSNFTGTKGIGSNNYTASQIGAMHLAITNSNPAAPYLGFGYDVAHFDRAGVNFNFGLEMGALYAGNPTVKLSTDKSPSGLDADLKKESETISSDVKKYYNFYPVLMLSGKISF